MQILEDLALPVPMMRLLQGDVGSGKTAVAFLALLAAAGSGYQSVLMAPTEVGHSTSRGWNWQLQAFHCHLQKGLKHCGFLSDDATKHHEHQLFELEC